MPALIDSGNECSRAHTLTADRSTRGRELPAHLLSIFPSLNATFVGHVQQPAASPCIGQQDAILQSHLIRKGSILLSLCSRAVRVEYRVVLPVLSQSKAQR